MSDDMISAIIFWYLVVIFCSCAYDVWSYEDRQTKWEKEHPGSTYIRHYRRFEKQSTKARRLGGQL